MGNHCRGKRSNGKREDTEDTRNKGRNRSKKSTMKEKHTPRRTKVPHNVDLTRVRPSASPEVTYKLGTGANSDNLVTSGQPEIGFGMPSMSGPRKH